MAMDRTPLNEIASDKTVSFQAANSVQKYNFPPCHPSLCWLYELHDFCEGTFKDEGVQMDLDKSYLEFPCGTGKYNTYLSF